MKDEEKNLRSFVLDKFLTEQLVEEINYRAHLYRVFEHVEYKEVEQIASLAMEELRIRALAGKSNE